MKKANKPVLSHDSSSWQIAVRLDYIKVKCETEGKLQGSVKLRADHVQFACTAFSLLTE